MSESVMHPTHYNIGKIEVIEVIEDWGLNDNFNLGSVVKYIARAQHKEDVVKDLKKAMWYLARELVVRHKVSPVEVALIGLTVDKRREDEWQIVSSVLKKKW